MPDPDEELFTDPVRAQEDADSAPDGAGEDEDDIEIGFEGEEAQPAGHDSDLVRRLRAELKDRELRLRTYEAPKPVEVGPMPDIDDFYASHPDNPKEAHAAALLAWNDNKAKADRAQKDIEKASQSQTEAWAKKVQTFETQKAELRRPDYAEAQENVEAALNIVQQRAIIAATKRPGAVVYALGKHPAKLAQVAAISDPIEFIAEIVRMEGSITVTNKRRPPEPEPVVRGSAGASRANVADKTLEKLELRAKTDPNFDRGEIVRYKRQLAEKQGARGGRR